MDNNIYAVVISYNPDITLLDSEYRSIIPQVSGIIYTDNDSKNKKEIIEWQKNKKNIDFIWLPENLGIGAAQNAGIKEALRKRATHIVLFDQDSVVESDFIAKLVQAEKTAINKGINVGLTGPIYSSYEGYKYPIPNYKDNKYIRIPIESIKKDFIEVSHIIASGGLIRKEVFETAGYMNEGYFIGFVDFEFCFRAAKYGFKSIVTKKAVMHHKLGDKQIFIFGRMIGLYSPFRRYFECRNVILIRKDKAFPKPFLNYCLRINFKKIFLSCLIGPHRFTMLKYCLIGLYDGLNNVRGKCTIK